MTCTSEHTVTQDVQVNTNGAFFPSVGDDMALLVAQLPQAYELGVTCPELLEYAVSTGYMDEGRYTEGCGVDMSTFTPSVLFTNIPNAVFRYALTLQYYGGGFSVLGECEITIADSQVVSYTKTWPDDFLLLGPFAPGQVGQVAMTMLEGNMLTDWDNTFTARVIQSVDAAGFVGCVVPQCSVAPATNTARIGIPIGIANFTRPIKLIGG